MARIRFEDMSEGEQIALLHEALTQLQNRFNNHEHGRSGGVMVSAIDGEVDLSGTWDDED